ncbi:hypothetical protein RHMOL_Rhmol01G0152200 [Rhododendron molle]|uniref:Uncharacterized protein n=1 Tax=Rhododendron molle TaxID=49168 RepID=A0ACC0Q4E8_RHOML|nr:hypothetical protein RHMOL_Rhmol01G0152200 [Rhododendron molle]
MNFRSSSITTFAILILSLSSSAAAVLEQELESMLTTLRTRGYTLFANAIFATNLFPDVLAGTSFSFFDPTDSSLHSLDMAATAADYVATLH